MKNHKLLLPFLIASLSLVGLIWAYRYHQAHCVQCISIKTFSPGVIKHFIQSFGSGAFFVYVFLYLVNTISLIPPIGIMSLTAGFVFGPLWGTVALMTGSFLGTTATFFISRHLGGHFVDKILKGRAREFQDKLNQNGFKVILFIRLVPLLPWEVVNYASGLSRIKYRDYIAGTLIGIFPAVVIQTYFSDRVSNFNLQDPTLLVAIGAFLLLGAVPAIYLKKKKSGRGLKVNKGENEAVAENPEFF